MTPAVKTDEDSKIKIPLGELQGKYLKSRDGKTYSAFLGIPYAEPPKRFEVKKNYFKTCEFCKIQLNNLTTNFFKSHQNR